MEAVGRDSPVSDLNGPKIFVSRPALIGSLTRHEAGP